MYIGKKKYQEMKTVKIKDNRNVVISRCLDNGGFSIAQKLNVDEEDKTIKIFLKGAIFVEDIETLTNLRDALSEIIDDNSFNDDDWDK